MVLRQIGTTHSFVQSGRLARSVCLSEIEAEIATAAESNLMLV